MLQTKKTLWKIRLVFDRNTKCHQKNSRFKICANVNVLIGNNLIIIRIAVYRKSRAYCCIVSTVLVCNICSHNSIHTELRYNQLLCLRINSHDPLIL